ncbi:hypothetical protein [uncultured Ilyobacter sp.]|uniref:hypothetical protein n=1 Tax=uncultured Ilyobacter sp. TaxID=544433 RepID=UPI0029C767D7|nr:hypothetical protein [uncultured Ilyobacter sp.]
MELREAIKNLLEFETTEDEICDIEKHINNPEYYSEKLQKVYDNHLNLAIDIFKAKTGKAFFKNINTLIIFASFQLFPDNPLETGIIEKNLRLFPGIKRIVVLYTKESLEEAEKLKKKYRDFEIIQREVKGSDYNHIYCTLKDIIRKECIEKENTVIDMTLGMKYVSTAYYKIGVEEGIRCVNWSELQLKGKNKFVRVPGSTRVEMFEEPVIESFKIRSEINSSIREFNFSKTSAFYNMINADERALFFKILGSIFSKEVLLLGSYVDIIDSIEENMEKIKNISSLFEKHSKYFKFLVILKQLSYPEGENREEILTDNFRQWKNKNFFLYETEKVLLINMLKLEYIFFNISSSSLRRELLDRIFIECTGERPTGESIEELACNLMELCDEKSDIESLDIGDTYEKYVSLKNFYEREKMGLSFLNGVVYIEKLNIEIDLKKHTSYKTIKNFLKNSSRSSKVIMSLLKNPNETLGKNSISEIFISSDKSCDSQNNFSKYFNDLKKLARELNRDLMEIAPVLGSDLILVDKKNKRIEINERFIRI